MCIRDSPVAADAVWIVVPAVSASPAVSMQYFILLSWSTVYPLILELTVIQYG